MVQNRLFGINYDVAVFTNLTLDHLDYHKTMENYMLAKRELFKMCKTAVVNFDDPYTKPLVEALPCDVVSYSTYSDDATYSAKGIMYRADGVDFDLVDMVL